MTSYKVSTLRDCIEGNYRIALHCEEVRKGLSCGYSKWLDLAKLTAKLGPDHSIMHDELVPHLWCLRCGSKNVGIRLHPPTKGQVNLRKSS